MIQYIILFLLFTTNAYALGIRSTANCGVDYFRYCSQYAIGSDEVRECFRGNRKNLSSYCIDALIADGEITKEDIEKAKEEDAKPIEQPKVEEIKPIDEIAKPVEEVKPVEEITKPVEEVKSTEPITIGKEPEKIKRNILQEIARKVAAKLKAPVPKQESIAAQVAAAVKKPTKNYSRKVQRGGKWDGFPLYLEWKDNRRELGGEITPYGYEDRLDN